MPVGKTPQNQLDALPLITAIDVAQPTETVIIGGSVTKFWNEIALGISAVPRTTNGTGQSYLVTPYLDLRAMNVFSFQIVAQWDATGEGAVGMSINPIYRLGAVAQSDLLDTIAQFSRAVAANTWPAMTSATRLLNIGFTNTDAPMGANQVSTALGTECRFIFWWSVAPSAHVNYTMTLCAHS